MLEELAGLGVGLHLDDFGAGHSSLTRVDKFPISLLKIDKYFVRRSSESEDGLGLLRTIAGMADALGLDVVAEGVETEAQQQLLTELGCRYGQGYLFSRPVTALEASAQLAAANTARLVA